MFYLGHKNTWVLCTGRDYLHYLNPVKSRQISNILTRGFLLMCKNGFYSATDQSKSQKRTMKTLSWNYTKSMHTYTFKHILSTKLYDRNCQIIFIKHYLFQKTVS